MAAAVFVALLVYTAGVLAVADNVLDGWARWRARRRSKRRLAAIARSNPGLDAWSRPRSFKRDDD